MSDALDLKDFGPLRIEAVRRYDDTYAVRLTSTVGVVQHADLTPDQARSVAMELISVAARCVMGTAIASVLTGFRRDRGLRDRGLPLDES